MITADYSGFFGEYAIGTIYRFDEKNEVQLALGRYPVGAKHNHQINFSYRRSPWQFEIEKQKWTPFQFGGFITYAYDGGKYFVKSPDQYPYKDYYDQTAIRAGFELGTVYAFNDHFEIAYHFRIIDTGLVAIYNNAHRDLQYYLSSGFALQYQF